MGLYFLGEGCLHRDSGKNKWVDIPFSDIKMLLDWTLETAVLQEKVFRSARGKVFGFLKYGPIGLML